MKKSIAVWILSAIFPLSAGAAELVIRETETAIIVELNGDTDDTKGEKVLQEAPVVDQAQPSQPSSPAAVKGKTAPPQTVAVTSAQQIIDRNTSMIRRAEIRRKAKESQRSSHGEQGAEEDD